MMATPLNTHNKYLYFILLNLLAYAVFVVTFNCASLPGAEPAPTLRLEARELFSLVPGNPADMVFIGNTADNGKSAMQKTAVVFESNGTVCLPFTPRYAGRIRLRIGYLTGGEYASFHVALNGNVVFDESKSSVLPQAEECAFDTEELPIEGNFLTLTTARPARLALLYLEWQPLDILPLAPDVWTDMTPSGSAPESLRRWRTYLYNPDPARLIQLRADDPAAMIHLNDKPLPLKPIKDSRVAQAVIPAELWRPGVNTLTVATTVQTAPQIALTTPADLQALAKLPPELTPSSTDDFPHTVLNNGLVQARVALPDPVRGFYRGNRFEAAGMVYSLRFRDTELFSNITPAREPLRSEDGMGNAEEFSEPLGYEEAAVGDSYLKIGVGRLQKALWNKYNFSLPAWPVELFPWQTAREGETLVFTQHGKQGAYGYRYAKRVALVPDKSALRVDYELTNTGTRYLRTSHYSHNFLRFADTAPGPDYTVRYNQPVRPQFNRYPSSAVLFRNGGLTLAPVDQTFFGRLLPAGKIVPTEAEVTCPALNVGLRLRHEGLPIFRLRFFMEKRILSPEFFVRLHLAPGETARWSRTWEAFTPTPVQ